VVEQFALRVEDGVDGDVDDGVDKVIADGGVTGWQRIF
jgi:hypothetical protein